MITIMKLIIIAFGVGFLSVYCVKLQFDVQQLHKQQRVLLSTNKANYDRAENFKALTESYQSLIKEIERKVGHDCPDLKLGPIHPPELQAPSMNSPNRNLPDIGIDSSEPSPDQQYKINGLMPRI